MQSTEGITVSLSLEEVDLLIEALSHHIAFNNKGSQQKNLPDAAFRKYKYLASLGIELSRKIYNKKKSLP